MPKKSTRFSNTSSNFSRVCFLRKNLRKNVQLGEKLKLCHNVSSVRIDTGWKLAPMLHMIYVIRNTMETRNSKRKESSIHKQVL